MKLSYVAAIACSVLISGCVQSLKRNEVQDNVTPVEYKSSLNSKALAICISDKWDKLNAAFTTFRIQFRPTANGHSVWAEQSVGNSFSNFSIKDSVAYLADITDVQHGSTIKYYALGVYKEEWESELNRCLNDTNLNTNYSTEKSSNEAPVNNTTTQKLLEINELRKNGLITEDEFQNKKKQLLEKL